MQTDRNWARSLVGKMRRNRCADSTNGVVDNSTFPSAISPIAPPIESFILHWLRQIKLILFKRVERVILVEFSVSFKTHLNCKSSCRCKLLRYPNRDIQSKWTIDSLVKKSSSSCSLEFNGSQVICTDFYLVKFATWWWRTYQCNLPECDST